MFRRYLLSLIALLSILGISTVSAGQLTINITNQTNRDILTHADGAHVSDLGNLNNVLISANKQVSLQVTPTSVSSGNSWIHIWYSWADGNSGWVWGMNKIIYLWNSIPNTYVCSQNGGIPPCIQPGPPEGSQIVSVLCDNDQCKNPVINITILEGVDD